MIREDEYEPHYVEKCPRCRQRKLEHLKVDGTHLHFKNCGWEGF